MFWNRKPPERPLAYPLGELEELLKQASIPFSREGSTLLVKHAKLSTSVSVVSPERRTPGEKSVQAVVQVKTKLAAEFREVLHTPRVVTKANSFAALGALTREGDEYFIGSRLTIFEGESAWGLYGPLLLFATAQGGEPMLGSLRRVLTRQPPVRGSSEWREKDFTQVQSHLSQVGVCTAGKLGLSAEFGLQDGAISALHGHRTVLWQLSAETSHPELGGGLLYCSYPIKRRATPTWIPRCSHSTNWRCQRLTSRHTSVPGARGSAGTIQLMFLSYPMICT